jgi:hypothetical protein
MGKYFLIAKREGRHGLDFIIESRVTGEVFFVLLDSRDYRFPLFSEIRKMFEHVREIRQWIKDGIIKFAGEQVVYLKVYI